MPEATVGAPYPLKLEPLLYRRVWGGDRLVGFHGPALSQHGPEGEPVGESWLAGEDNVVVNGAFAGSTVAEVARRLGADLVGSVAFERYGARMPLLAKLLDAAQDLSVQVHPDDAYALREEAASGHLGKSEAWYVLEAEPDASVLWGFTRDVTEDELRASVESGRLPELMNRVSVAPGDVVVNPAGTVHAVGAGVRLFEIQQASDLTYRIYDHGRVGADGRPRQLHLDRALAVSDLHGRRPTPAAPRELSDGWRRLVERPEFVMDELELTAERDAVAGVDPASLELLTALDGEFTLSTGAAEREWEAVTLLAGDTVLLPAALSGPVKLNGTGTLLRCAVVKDVDG